MGNRTYAEQLRLAHGVTEPAIRQAIRYLELAPGTVGLDAGCGIGRHTLWLAEAVGGEGVVTGLDICPENLAAARELVSRSPLSGRVVFREWDIRHLPFEDDSFHWVWCADTLWPVHVAEGALKGARRRRKSRPLPSPASRKRSEV